MPAEELNPENEVLRELRGSWQVIVALLMVKFQVENLQITEADVRALAARFPGDRACVVADGRRKELWLRLMSETEGRAMLRSN